MKSVRCASCSTELPDGAKFCGNCGTPVAVRCAVCDTPAAQAGQRFCLECGTPLAQSTAKAASAPAVPAPASVERRLVSVLFADLTGFTSFSESRDAEDVRAMLSEYFDGARRIIESYGGKVEKFIGDAVMGVWGAPIAHEDDAERAVRAALDLVAAVTGLGDRLALDLRLRAGVLTGEAAVELDAVAEGMVIGDAVNTASRIQSAAAPGSVLVDDVTRLVTERSILYEDGGARRLKGKSGPVRTWRPLRVVAAVGGMGRTLVELPLIGRKREMTALRAALDGVREPGARLRLLSVVGDAGMGKSRLAWELEKYGDGLAARVLWHRGRTSSFGHGVGFSALAEMVRMRAEINVVDAAPAQRTKLQALLDDLFGADRDARVRVGRALARLLGVDDGHELIDRGELFSSWRLLFQRLAAADPVILLFEDLHWADQGLFDFIGHLAEWAAASPILVLAFSRPDDRLETLVPFGDRLELDPLSGEEIEVIVGAAVLDAPAALVRTVREHAAGIPLFAVESLRMLAGRGLMVAEGESDCYRLVGSVDELEVPPSIHALVAARLDALGPLERRLLLDGAVLGQRFDVGAAAALAGLGERDVRSLLDGLVAKQFLTIDTDPRSPERGHYGFVHRQVQRVALGTMSKHARKARHLAAVEHLSSREPDPDLAGILVSHLLAAADADPRAPDAEAIRRRALGTMLEAAERAESVGALGEAVALYDRAAEIEPDELRRTGHLVRAARCAEHDGHREAAAAERYEAARELHERAGREREALRLRARELRVYRWTRAPAQLIGPLRDVYEALRGERDGAFADAAVSLASVLYGAGDAAATERVAAEAAEAAENAGAHEELGLALTGRASALIELARPAEALEVFRAALRTGERHAPAQVPGALINIAITLAALGRFEEACGAGRQAMDAAERMASGLDHNLAALHLARSQFSLGRWDEALAMVDAVAAETAPANEGMTIGPPLLTALYRGELERARTLIDRFDRRRAESGAAFESDYRALLGVAHAYLDADCDEALRLVLGAEAGDYAEWPTWLPAAVDLLVCARDDGPLQRTLAALRGPVPPKTSPLVTTQIERLAAHLAARAGEEDRAAAHWRTGQQIAADAGMRFATAVLAVEVAERLPHHAGAMAGLPAAADVCRELRAAPWLERAEAVLRAGAGETAGDAAFVAGTGESRAAPPT